MQAMSAAAGMTVKVSTTPIFSKIPRAQTNKDFQVLLRIEAPPPVDLKGRVPIDLVMVLDVGGGTVSLEPVKKAMKFAIRQLSDEDSVAIFGPPMSREVIPKFMNIHGSRRIAEKKVDELEGRRFAHPARSSLDEALKVYIFVGYVFLLSYSFLSLYIFSPWSIAYYEKTKNIDFDRMEKSIL